jgi:hypothetical protein
VLVGWCLTLIVGTCPGPECFIQPSSLNLATSDDHNIPAPTESGFRPCNATSAFLASPVVPTEHIAQLQQLILLYPSPSVHPCAVAVPAVLAAVNTHEHNQHFFPLKAFKKPTTTGDFATGTSIFPFWWPLPCRRSRGSPATTCCPDHLVRMNLPLS